MGEKSDIANVPAQDWFLQRAPLFFRSGTFERSLVWDNTNKVLYHEIMRYFD